MINIVIPMAGAGSRFSNAGYADPKPLIPINGVPMIKLVVDNIKSKNIKCNFIFICQKEHVKLYNLKLILNEFIPGCKIIEIDGITEGAACTVLKAEFLINNNTPLMIANSDQFIDIQIDDYLRSMDDGKFDGYIMTMTASDPKWSFVGFDNNGNINQVVEKKVISEEATVGIYNFLTGSLFVNAAKQMIAANDRVNNEFYVAPVYNYMIKNNSKVGYYNIGSEFDGMYGLGTPDDLNKFLITEVCKKIYK
jgi:dTDP-glucose pyrophosphorylase